MKRELISNIIWEMDQNDLKVQDFFTLHRKGETFVWLICTVDPTKEIKIANYNLYAQQWRSYKPGNWEGPFIERGIRAMLNRHSELWDEINFEEFS